MRVEDILSALPSREDVASAIGLEARSSAGWGALVPLGIFAGGLVVGAGMSLLLAPTTGQDARREIASKVGDLADRLRPGTTPHADSGSSSPHPHNLTEGSV